MNNDKVAEISAFVAKVEALLEDLEKWASKSHLQTVREKVDISEEMLGTYSVPSLTISDRYGNILAEIVPIGTRILGANGRIDLRGRYDKAIVLDLNEGGPTLATTVVDGSSVQKRMTKFYRGIEQAGWYWIDRTAQPKGHVFTKELFWTFSHRCQTMSALSAINEVWNSYQTTIECLKVVARVVKRKDISVLDKTNFIGAPVGEAASRISSSTEHANDYVILALWTLFERYLFLHVQKESKRMLQVSTTRFTQETQQKIENELEYWRVDEVLDLFKTIIDSNLIGQAKQVKQYRDWVAHRNPKKPPKTNVPPQTAYVVLSTIVQQLEAHPEMQRATSA